MPKITLTANDILRSRRKVERSKRGDFLFLPCGSVVKPVSDLFNECIITAYVGAIAMVCKINDHRGTECVTVPRFSKYTNYSSVWLFGTCAGLWFVKTNDLVALL